jgi:catechol 2,3-dioxygenase-like lactoylglutathione lyase family enzyme
MFVLPPAYPLEFRHDEFRRAATSVGMTMWWTAKECAMTNSTRISKVVNVVVPVADVDRAIEFYTGPLGLEKRTDVPFGDQYRWVEVAPAGAETVIAIAPPGPDGQTGGRQTGISLQTDDIDALHAQLKAAGVDVDHEVSRMGGPVPPMFWLRDPEANVLLIVEVR